MIEEFLLILNRIAGSADEMGSFLLRLHRDKREFELQLQQERLTKSEAVDSIERELGAVKAALVKAARDKSLSESERLKLQMTLDRVPEIYKRDPLDGMKKLIQEASERHQRQVRDLMGNPGGMTDASEAVARIQARIQERQARALEDAKKIQEKKAREEEKDNEGEK